MFVLNLVDQVGLVLVVFELYFFVFLLVLKDSLVEHLLFGLVLSCNVVHVRYHLDALLGFHQSAQDGVQGPVDERVDCLTLPLVLPQLLEGVVVVLNEFNQLFIFGIESLSFVLD